MKKFYLAAAAALVLALTIATVAFAAFPGSPTVVNQAKKEILAGKVRGDNDTFKMVLKTQATATNDIASMGSYTTQGELATSGGYTAGGQVLSGCTTTLNGTTAQFTCSAASWTTTSAIVFDAVEIYDSSCGANSCLNANQVVGLFPVTSMTCPSSGTCTVTLPAATFQIQ